MGEAKQMQWSRSETLALAQQSCSICYGLGLRPGRGGESTPCNCVFRSIFRACKTARHPGYGRRRYCCSRSGGGAPKLNSATEACAKSGESARFLVVLSSAQRHLDNGLLSPDCLLPVGCLMSSCCPRNRSADYLSSRTKIAEDGVAGTPSVRGVGGGRGQGADRSWRRCAATIWIFQGWPLRGPARPRASRQREPMKRKGRRRS